MAVAITEAPSAAPIIGDHLDKIGVPTPSFTRSGTATRVNENGQVQFTNVNIPRFDYNPVTLVLRGLLIEESRTNRCLFSEQINNAGGSPAAWSSAGVTGSANSAAAPDGETTADQFTENSAMSTHSVAQIVTITAGAAFAFSIFVKRAVGTRHLRLQASTDAAANGFRAFFDLGTGAVNSTASFGTGAFIGARIDAHASNWYRVSIFGRAGAAATSLTVTAFFQETVNGSASYTGDGASALYLWGAQVEQGEFPTSYIPTTTDPVTRGADLFTVAGMEEVFNYDEGCLFAEFERADAVTGNGRIAVFDDGISSLTTNGLLLDVSDGGSPNEQIVRSIYFIATNTAWSLGERIAESTVVRAAIGYDEAVSVASPGTGRLYVDGVQTDTQEYSPSAVLTPVTTLSIGSYLAGLHFNGHLRKVRYYDEELTAEELAALTRGEEIAKQPAIAFNFVTESLADQTGSLDHARIGYHTRTRSGTVVASSAHASYPADAAQRPDTFEAWQPTALPATWEEPDPGAQVVCDYLAIAEHDLGTKECSVTAQYSHDRGTWVDASDAFQPDAGDDSPILLMFSPIIARYWRLYIEGLGSPTADVPTIAVIHIGQLLTLQRAIYGGHAPVELSDETLLRTNRLTGGQFAGQSFEAHGVVTQAALRYLTPAWVRENFQPFKKAARRYPYFWAWRPEAYPKGCAYVWTPEDIRPSNQGVREFMQVSWPMEGIGQDEDDD